MEDYSETCDYESLKKEILKCLNRYFESGGPEYDPNYSAQDCVDDIAEAVGFDR